MIKLKTEQGKAVLSTPALKGEDGGYYIPEVSDNGDLSWMPTNDNMPIPEVVNIMGTIEFENLTEEQKQEIINGVLDALPNADEVRY